MKILYTNSFDYDKLHSIIQKLKDIAIEKDIVIVTAEQRPIIPCYGQYDHQQTLWFFEEYNRYDNLQRIEKRRKKRHVSRCKRNIQQKRRKKYLGKTGMSAIETVQCMEQGGLTYIAHKSRTGQKSLGICFNTSN